MNSKINPLYSVPAAILLGSLVIALAILLSGGVIKIGKKDQVLGVGGSAGNTVTNQAQPAAAKTEAGIVEILKSYASRLSLNAEKFNSCLGSGEKAPVVGRDLEEGSKVGVDGTPAFFVNGRLLSGAQPYDVFKKIIDEELVNQPSGIDRKDVSTGDLPVLGNPNAKVTIIEFSDYECPFCSRFFTQTEGNLKKDYIDSGKVKFYYRDFPLTQIHIGAQKAAEAARCAGDQGKYWQYHDLIFQNQDSIFR